MTHNLLFFSEIDIVIHFGTHNEYFPNKSVYPNLCFYPKFKSVYPISHKFPKYVDEN